MLKLCNCFFVPASERAVCVYLWVCRCTGTLVWGPLEVRGQCPCLPLSLFTLKFEAVSTTPELVILAEWLVSFRELPIIIPYPLVLSSYCVHACLPHQISRSSWLFMWALGIWTQVLVFTWQTFYLLNQVPHFILRNIFFGQYIPKELDCGYNAIYWLSSSFFRSIRSLWFPE